MAYDKITRRALNFKNLSGLVFGRLTVIDFRERINRRTLWNCVCACGNECVISTNHLRQGLTKSCGCLAIERVTKHGLRRSKEYKAWVNAKNRCTNPNVHNFARYGGRGITMCAEWVSSFTAFYRDMGPCPRGMTLDRKDNDSGYNKENCRWVSTTEQARNRSITVLVTHNNETRPLAEWSELLGIPYGILKHRHRNGRHFDAPYKSRR